MASCPLIHSQNWFFNSFCFCFLSSSFNPSKSLAAGGKFSRLFQFSRNPFWNFSTSGSFVTLMSWCLNPCSIFLIIAFLFALTDKYTLTAFVFILFFLLIVQLYYNLGC